MATPKSKSSCAKPAAKKATPKSKKPAGGYKTDKKPAGKRSTKS